MPRHDLIIVGAGPVGMTLALALKDSGLDILLVDARARGAARHDPRLPAPSPWERGWGEGSATARLIHLRPNPNPHQPFGHLLPEGEGKNQPANASRVRLIGAPSVQTTSSSMRMPP